MHVCVDGGCDVFFTRDQQALAGLGLATLWISLCFLDWFGCGLGGCHVVDSRFVLWVLVVHGSLLFTVRMLFGGLLDLWCLLVVGSCGIDWGAVMRIQLVEWNNVDQLCFGTCFLFCGYGRLGHLVSVS